MTANEKTRVKDTILLLFVFFGFIGTSSAAFSQQEKVFRMSVFATTRTDPPGASNAVIAYVMAQHGYKTEFVLTPTPRMQYSLRGHVIDSMQASGIARSTRQLVEKDPFIQAKYPIVSFPVSIYYKKSDQWKPSWPAQSDFIEKPRGVSNNYNYLTLRGFDITRVPTPIAGAKMVNFGRADYWIEVMSISPEGSIRNGIDKGFTTEKLFDSPMFLLFNDDEQGREFKRIWDTEFAKLMRNPDMFAEVYLKGLPKAYFTGPMNDFQDYVYRIHPELLTSDPT